MGCVSAKEVDADAAAIVKEKAAKQRRRLSVAPEQVGDISNQNATEKASPAAVNTNAPEAAPEKQAEPAATPAATALASEAKDARVDAGAATAAAPQESREAKQYTPMKIMFAEFSKKGYVPYNRNKVNQDRAVSIENLANNPDLALFAVMDGHGEFGHLVAQFVRDNLPVQLEKQPDLATNTPHAMINAVAGVVAGLSNTAINIAFSGTTLVFAVKNRNRLFVGNVGDSRCVLGRRSADGKLEAVPLTQDQKPDSPDEKARILKAGGRVEPLPGPPNEDCGPNRVWLADVDVPGLAMSRSIGDEVSQTVGVISVPEVKEHVIGDKDLFIVLASDGVWEFVPNESAVELISNNFEVLPKACSKLVEASHHKWEQEEEVVDDITCIIVNLVGHHQ